MVQNIHKEEEENEEIERRQKQDENMSYILSKISKFIFPFLSSSSEENDFLINIQSIQEEFLSPKIHHISNLLKDDDKNNLFFHLSSHQQSTTNINFSLFDLKNLIDYLQIKFSFFISSSNQNYKIELNEFFIKFKEIENDENVLRKIEEEKEEENSILDSFLQIISPCEQLKEIFEILLFSKDQIDRNINDQNKNKNKNNLLSYFNIKTTQEEEKEEENEKLMKNKKNYVYQSSRINSSISQIKMKKKEMMSEKKEQEEEEEEI